VVRILAQRDVEDLLDLETATACLEHTFLDQGQGHVTAWPRFAVGNGPAAVRTLPGAAGDPGHIGFRLTAWPPAGSGVTFLFDGTNAQPVCLMANPFSKLRVAASIAVGVKWLASPGPQRIAMLGAGRNAMSALTGAASMLDVKDVRVFSPIAEHRMQFAKDAAVETGLPVTAVAAAADAVRGATTVVVMTNARTPALQGDWLEPGALVVASGSRTEIDDHVLLRAGLIVTTSKVHELNPNDSRPSWPFVSLPARGLLDMDSVVELGSVVAGDVTRPDGIAVFSEAFGGFTDIALAGWCYERACELDRGVEVDLGIG
jgi:alanine dehydrogenase